MRGTAQWGRRRVGWHDAAMDQYSTAAKQTARGVVRARQDDDAGGPQGNPWCDAEHGDRMTYSRNMVWDNMAGSRFSCQWRAERIRLLIVHALPDRFDSGQFWEGRRLMRTTARICLMLMAGALAGCQSTNGVQFVASNPDSVLLDYAANPPGNLTTAGDTATQQCQIFNRRIAVLESLNVRDEGVIRATYLCRNSIATASAAPDVMRRRQ